MKKLLENEYLSSVDYIGIAARYGNYGTGVAGVRKKQFPEFIRDHLGYVKAHSGWVPPAKPITEAEAEDYHMGWTKSKK